MFNRLTSFYGFLCSGMSRFDQRLRFAGAAWLIGFMAPYLNWPNWVVRLAIFDAFGHP